MIPPYLEITSKKDWNRWREQQSELLKEGSHGEDNALKHSLYESPCNIFNVSSAVVNVTFVGQRISLLVTL